MENVCKICEHFYVNTNIYPLLFLFTENVTLGQVITRLCSQVMDVTF